MATTYAPYRPLTAAVSGEGYYNSAEAEGRGTDVATGWYGGLDLEVVVPS